MKYIIDTHTFLWFIDNNPLLSKTSENLIRNLSNEIFISIASIWEIGIKISIGKFKIHKPFENFITEQLKVNTFTIIPINIIHIDTVINLSFHHRDPFDR